MNNAEVKLSILTGGGLSHYGHLYFYPPENQPDYFDNVKSVRFDGTLRYGLMVSFDEATLSAGAYILQRALHGVVHVRVAGRYIGSELGLRQQTPNKKLLNVEGLWDTNQTLVFMSEPLDLVNLVGFRDKNKSHKVGLSPASTQQSLPLVVEPMPKLPALPSSQPLIALEVVEAYRTSDGATFFDKALAEDWARNEPFRRWVNVVTESGQLNHQDLAMAITANWYVTRKEAP